MKKLWNRKPAGNFFPLPNALFRLNLLPGEIAVYAYLMYRENRQTYQCHPSYATIGRAIHMSPNTVRKYVSSLVEKRLIYTEPTSIITKKGEKRNVERSALADRFENEILFPLSLDSMR